MTNQEINNFRTRVSAFIDKRRLRDAINEIKSMASRRMAWEIDDKIKQTEQNYAYMLRYLTEGAADPTRDDIYTSLIADIYELLDALIFYIENVDSPTLFHSTIRTSKIRRPQRDIETILKEYAQTADKFSLFALASSPTSDEKNERKNLETLQSEIFMWIWTSRRLTKDAASAIEDVLKSETTSVEMKQFIISAVTLGLLQIYDKSKLRLLMSAYLGSRNVRVTSAAIVGMLLGLSKYKNRPLTRQLSDILMTVKDAPNWSRDLRITFIEMIRARDTERINKKMRDEVIPKMESLRPTMMDKFKDLNLEDPALIQENPEWQELLDKSGVTDQLKELMEIQMDGGDVMMSTFAHLKQFPFFQNLANWFLPFDGKHSTVAETMGDLDIFADIMENAHFLCDSDKYSFIFALAHVPAAQKEMMISQLKAQSSNLYEAMTDMSANQGPDSFKAAVNSYLQNIYRFFKLYGRKDEFYDPFSSGINLISVKALADDFDDPELLQVVAEFYFKLQYMRDALDVFKHLESIQPGDSSRYQKMGYSHERLRDYAHAIDYYHKAELLETENTWTTRRLATCYRQMGDNEQSLKYFKQLATKLPYDKSVTMLYGQALMENGDYEEAMNQFFKVEFLDETSTRTWRPLAWLLFLSGNFEESAKYYKKILDDNPTANDYLNMGHLALATSNIRDAVNNYTMAIKSAQGDKEWFRQALIDDETALKNAGVDLSILPLIADATMYGLE